MPPKRTDDTNGLPLVSQSGTPKKIQIRDRAMMSQSAQNKYQKASE